MSGVSHSSRCRLPAPVGDEGAAAIEYLGGLLAAAALVGAAMLSVPATATGLAANARWAACMVLSVGLGDCSRPAPQAAAHVPTEPCARSSTSGAITRSVTVLSGTGSAGNTYQLTRLSDGRYQVSEILEGAGGVQFGVGEKVTVRVGDGTYGSGATAEATAVVNAQAGRVWYADDLDEANRMISTLRGDAIQDTVVGGNPIADGLWSLGRGAVDLITRHDSGLPTPDETMAAGGATLSASADVTALALGASASASDAQVLGVRQSAGGNVTVYLQTTLDASVAGNAAQAAASRGGGISLITAVTFDSAWDLTQVSTSSISTGDANHLTNLLFRDQTPAGQSDVTEYSAILTTRTEADRQTALRFLAASGIGQLNLGPLGIASPTGSLLPTTTGVGPAAIGEFIGASRDHGVVTRQQFTDESGGFGAAADLELGLAVGGGLDYTTQTRTSVAAAYWDGTAWVPRPECAG